MSALDQLSDAMTEYINAATVAVLDHCGLPETDQSMAKVRGSLTTALVAFGEALPDNAVVTRDQLQHVVDEAGAAIVNTYRQLAARKGDRRN